MTVNLACILSVTDGDYYKIRVRGRVYNFEFSERFGPLVEGKGGKIVEQPPPRSLFWRAVSLWELQGRAVSPDGFCEWREPKRPVTEIRHGKRHIVAHGEPGWDW